MKAVIIGKYMVAWTASWKVQPDHRFRIGLTIYKRLCKLGYFIIAKKA